MSEIKELVEFLDRIYETWEFEERHNEKSSPNDLVESEVMFTEIKKKLEIYEQLFGDELIEIQEQPPPPDSDLVERILNIGIIFQQATVNHGIQCLSPLWNAKQIKAKVEICKLLQSRQPAKPRFFKVEIETLVFQIKQAIDPVGLLSLELKSKGVRVVEK